MTGEEWIARMFAVRSGDLIGKRHANAGVLVCFLATTALEVQPPLAFAEDHIRIAQHSGVPSGGIRIAPQDGIGGPTFPRAARTVRNCTTQFARGEIAFPKTGVEQIEFPGVQHHIRSNRTAFIPTARRAAANRLARVLPCISIG